jgi:hypothetical protein
MCDSTEKQVQLLIKLINRLNRPEPAGPTGLPGASSTLKIVRQNVGTNCGVKEDLPE